MTRSQAKTTAGARRGIAGLVLLVLTAATMGACGDASSPPSPTPRPSAPDITGVVWQVSDGGDGTGSLLVVGLQGAPGSYDRASVHLTKDTTWLDGGGGAMATPALDRELVGRRVAVTFTGAVAESYPVQAAASTVTLVDPLGVSAQISLAGEPQLRGTCLAADRDAAGKIASLTVAPHGTLPAADTDSGATSADYVAVTVKITDATSWILDTPTEVKSSQAPLIGNGLEPRVDVRLKGRTAVWVVVHMRDVFAEE